MQHTDRRDFLKLAGMAGVTFTAGLFASRQAAAQASDFHFVQFSDTHWGYKGAANPDAEHTLEKAVATVNGLAKQPDFIVFTGDLTHTTDDGGERRTEFKAPFAHSTILLSDGTPQHATGVILNLTEVREPGR